MQAVVAEGLATIPTNSDDDGGLLQCIGLQPKAWSLRATVRIASISPSLRRPIRWPIRRTSQAPSWKTRATEGTLKPFVEEGWMSTVPPNRRAPCCEESGMTNFVGSRGNAAVSCQIIAGL